MTAQEDLPLSNKRTLITESSATTAQSAAVGKGQLLLEWMSPSRPFCRRSREYYTTGAALVFLVAVIFFLIQEWFAIGAILAIAFVAYVFSTVPPEKVKHRITTFGVETIGHRYPWWQLYEFWFEEKWGSNILVIQTHLSFPGRIHILLGDADRQKVKELLQQYLPYRPEPARTFVDRVASWLSRKIPLETVAP